MATETLREQYGFPLFWAWGQFTDPEARHLTIDGPAMIDPHPSWVYMVDEAKEKADNDGWHVWVFRMDADGSTRCIKEFEPWGGDNAE